LIAALAALVAPLSCSGTPPQAYCVFENGALGGGRCLTDCESRCALESAAGCGYARCAKDCEALFSAQSAPCLDARHSYWRCLRVSGWPAVTCDAGRASFSAPASTCAEPQRAALEKCGVAEGGLLADDVFPLDSGAPDAALRDASE
jgi:hypothetical protein